MDHSIMHTPQVSMSLIE